MNIKTREHSINVSDSRLIRKRLFQLNGEKQFDSFDKFITKKVLEKEKGQHIEDADMQGELFRGLQNEAYLLFYRTYRAKNVASRVTIKKWFGLDGYARPKRKQIFRLAFAMHLKEAELQEYLMMGIRQPGIQINDYREMLYLYALEKNLSYEECLDMIRVFEIQMYRDTVFAQSTHTRRLWNMYRMNCDKTREQFLSWMCKNAGFFKGYSKVALKHFMDVKSEMLQYIRINAREQLLRLLEETDFYDWAAQNDIDGENYGENISRYIKNISRRKEKGVLTEELKAEILELNWIAHSSRDKTTDLLAELYSTAMESDKNILEKGRIRYKDRKRFRLPGEIFFMTDKYISQIVGIAQQKEKEIRLSQALVSLEDMEGVCPEWVRELLAGYGIKPPEEVKQAREVLCKAVRTQEQRCHLVQREDLLPLIHYVAQRRYERMLQEQGTAYQCEEARIFFIEMADRIFAECQMAPVNEEYHLDYLLLSCYGEDYMYSLADIIEESEMGPGDTNS